MTNKSFNILSIDGGGIRGIFPAHLLACMNERLGINILDSFDMVTGTSTGAIVAAGVVSNVDANDLVNLFKEKGSEIFKRKCSFLPKGYQPGFGSIYDNKVLAKTLTDILGEVTLGEITKPLLLPATDIGYGGVHVFKSSYSKDFTRDKEVRLVDAVLASCAAPTFFNPVKVQQYLLADGGLWANNPSLAAVIDANRRLEIPIERVKILSLGTGHSRKAYGMELDKNWGLLNGWKGKEFIEFMMSLQAQSTANYLQLLLKPEQVLRIDFESDNPLPLDDVTQVDELISRADREFTHESSRIKDFIERTSS
ncbi:MAG: patatin-like phospholipase family protein [Cocleimonas sp.]|nr:patatin-like phospholipase family protein [Cocleimonas sp.]